jgi:exopolysaccharide biosynthesis protein
MIPLYKIHMKIVLILLLVCFASQYSIAQTDSLAVVKAHWETKKIAKGIKLKQHWFDHSLFGSNENISILEIKMNRRNKLDVAAEPKTLKPASEFGNEEKAVAAINGTFFNMKNGGSEDYIRLDGQALNETHIGKNGKRSFHQRSAIVIDGPKVSIQAWDGSEDWESKLKGEDVMVTGPLLLDDEKRVPLDSITFNTARHPRTALAIKGNKVLLITVDGRNERSAGMSLYELASVLKWLKADDGINLDGGGSTTMWVNGQEDGGVVNHPSDNKKMMKSADYKPGMDLDNLAADTTRWDHGGERKVANVIVVRKR